MPLSALEKVRQTLRMSIEGDDKKLDRSELTAVLALAKGTKGKLSTDVAKELTKLYEKADKFESPSVRKTLKTELISAGVPLTSVGLKLTNTSAALTAFEKLTDGKKVKTLFPEYVKNAENGAFQLSPQFESVPVRLVDFLSGAKLTAAVQAYNQAKEESKRNGGGAPQVRAIVKDSVVFGFTFETSGRSTGNWGATQVYGRGFEQLGQFGWSD